MARAVQVSVIVDRESCEREIRDSIIQVCPVYCTLSLADLSHKQHLDNLIAGFE